MMNRSARLSFLMFSLATVVACDEQGNGDGDADDGAHDDGGDGGPGAEHPLWLPTGEPDNTSAPTVEVDASGAMHAVYPSYAGGRAYYAYCGDGCEDSDDVAVVRFDTDSSVHNAMIALAADGTPHVLLATSTSIAYAQCQGDCTDPAAWTTSTILVHDGDREVTGEAFALDGDGHPRFLMHTYVAYLGIGQKTPETHWVACDEGCNDVASWTSAKISDQIWQSTQLKFDAQGTAHIATVAQVVGEYGESTQNYGAYLRCDDGCDDGERWLGTSVAPAFSSDFDAVSIRPAIALALTSAGNPRMVMLVQDENLKRNLSYMSCDGACTAFEDWGGVILSEGDDIGEGLDIAVDANDHPRFVYTFDYDIGLAHCDTEPCDTADSPWELQKVEAGGDMAADDIFLWENCDVAAWFLHGPSIAIGPDGASVVGYQARDISGGWDNPDPDDLHDCVAGTDMTWSRFARMPAL